MEEQEIEKLLQESANKIKIKNFDSRWQSIQDKYNKNKASTVQGLEPVAVSAESNKTVNYNKRKVILPVFSCMFLLLILLVISLSILLGKSNNKRYFDLSALTAYTVDEHEFYNKINETEMKLVDFSDYDSNSFSLLYASENVRGGKIELLDYSGVYIVSTFYDLHINSDFKIGINFKSVSIGKTNINYKTECEDGAYSTTAIAKTETVIYELSVIHADDNFEEIANKLFG